MIENVAQAREDMVEPVTLCGTMFGLGAVDTDGQWLELRRHRLFESNIALTAPGPCVHTAGVQVGGVYGGARSDKVEAREVRHGGYVPAKAVQERLIGVPAGVHTLKGLWQSIPPAYTRHVGAQLLAAVEARSIGGIVRAVAA